LRDPASHDEHASVSEIMIKSTNHMLSHSRCVLFHFANALGLLDIVLGDGDWR
jgi:hypothetical protein